MLLINQGVWRISPEHALQRWLAHSMRGHSWHESWTQKFAVADLHGSKRAVVLFALADLLAASVAVDAWAKR